MISRLRASGRIAFSLALVLAAGNAVFAASAYVEQTQKTGAFMGQPATSTTQKMWLTDEAICTYDTSNGTAVIVRGDKVYIVMEPQKTVYETSMEQYAAMANAAFSMLQMMNQGQEIKASLTETDATAMVGEWNAKKYVLRLTGPLPLEINMWYSDDAGINMKDWSSLMDLVPWKSLLGDAMSQVTVLDGYPVKVETSVNMQGMTMTQTSEVTKIRKGNVEPPEVCGPPQSFTTKQGMPGMDMLPQGQP